jgi:hypothetical protein
MQALKTCGIGNLFLYVRGVTASSAPLYRRSTSVGPYRATSGNGVGLNTASQTRGRSFTANAVRLQLRALAYNLGNFLRTLAMPEAIKNWSLTRLKEKLIKIGAKVVSHGHYITFQMAEVTIT